MTFCETVRHLNSRQMFGVKLGLENIKNLLARLGNPEKNFDSIHIAGTNGKGSTAAIIASVFDAQGYATGLYTSPHITTVRERFAVNSRLISPREFASLYEELAQHLDDIPCTYFECTTALAFLYFSRKKVERAVVEVGLGGRFDATNVLTPICSVITTISFDHEQYLGTTLGEITREKCGIITKGVPVVSGVKQNECQKIIQQETKKKESTLFDSDVVVDIHDVKSTSQGSSFHAKLSGTIFPKLNLSLPGLFQIENARTALAALYVIEHYTIKNAHHAIRKGLESVVWNERFTQYGHDPALLIDVTHNEAGFQAMAENLRNLFPGRDVILVVGLKEDKSFRNVLAPVLPICKTGIGVPVTNSARIETTQKSASAKQLRGLFENTNIPFRYFPTVRSGVRFAKSIASKDDVIVCTGSHYTIDKFKKAIKSLD